MNDAEEQLRREVALFRYGLVADLVHLPPGQPRRLPAEVAELLISIKTEHQSWSVRQVIAGVVASGHLPDGVRPAHSTVHRLLRAEGLMSKPTAAGDGTDRRRFSYRFAGQLWMSDVMHGPSVTDGNRRRKSYLISFLDDATRVSPVQRFRRRREHRRLPAGIQAGADPPWGATGGCTATPRSTSGR